MIDKDTVTITALDLMAAADHLTGVRPGMTPHEIHAKQLSATPERQKAIYLCALLRKSRDSAERAEIQTRMDALVAEFGHLGSVIKQELAGRVLGYIPPKRSGRPKTYASETIRRREKQRRARARTKQGSRP